MKYISQHQRIQRKGEAWSLPPAPLCFVITLKSIGCSRKMYVANCFLYVIMYPIVRVGERLKLET